MNVGQVDLFAESIRLNPGETKNGEGRKVSLTAGGKNLLAACVTGKGPEASVFMRKCGKPVRDFPGTWDKLTLAAGCPVLLFHDLCRSAVRGMIRAGVPEVVCMKISGHKTRNVFDRYNITSKLK